MSTNQIKFIFAFNQPKDIRYCPYDKVNSFKFSKCGFNERITKDTPYIHPYFDIDHLETVEEFTKFVDYCDKAKEVIGDYSIGGYTNNQEFANSLGFKY